MDVASARARLVDADDYASAALATIPRSEFEEALGVDDGPPELILDVMRYTGEGEAQTAEAGKLSVFWGREELEQILRNADGDTVTLAFDADELLRALEADVEPHGMREAAAALAVAIVAASGAGVANAAPVASASVTSPEAVRVVNTGATAAAPGVDIDLVRATNTTPATPAPGVDIDLVRATQGTPPATPAPGVDIDLVRAGNTTPATPAPGVDIDLVRATQGGPVPTAPADIETIRFAAGAEAIEVAAATQANAQAEAARLAAASQAIESARDTGSGVSVSLPSPAATGALAGGMLLLISGAAFVLRGRQGPGPKPA
jgi:hypothetical protein